MLIPQDIIQPSNPTDCQRYEMIKNALVSQNRLEDFANIIKLLNPPPDILNFAPPGSFKNTKVGIIGGGLAAMGAAFELRKLGVDITIIDALSDRVGGRVYTYYFDEYKKKYGELGAIMVPVSHNTTWYYINLFGLNTEPFLQSTPQNFVYVNKKRIRNRPNLIEKCIYPTFCLSPKEMEIPWPTLQEYSLNFNLYKLCKDIRCEILKVLPKYAEEYEELIDISLLENFQEMCLSRGAIQMISSLNPLAGSFLSNSYAEILSNNYPVVFSAPQYRIAGGNSNLPKAFYNSLLLNKPTEYKNICETALGKITWKSGSFVDGIYQSDLGRSVTLRYRNKITDKHYKSTYDFVICAIPFSVLNAVEIGPYFSNNKMEAIRNINYVNSHISLLLCDKRFWEENTNYGRMNGGVSITDLLIKLILYPNDHIKTCLTPKSSGVLTGCFNLNNFATDIGNSNTLMQFELVKRQIEKVHGLPSKYLDSVVSSTKSISWSNEDYFRGAFAFFTPQQKKLYSYDILTPEFNNRVYFAGEHTSATHGSMQGALYSGKAAANRIAITLSSCV